MIPFNMFNIFLRFGHCISRFQLRFLIMHFGTCTRPSVFTCAPALARQISLKGRRMMLTSIWGIVTVLVRLKTKNLCTCIIYHVMIFVIINYDTLRNNTSITKNIKRTIKNLPFFTNNSNSDHSYCWIHLSNTQLLLIRTDIFWFNVHSKIYLHIYNLSFDIHFSWTNYKVCII